MSMNSDEIWSVVWHQDGRIADTSLEVLAEARRIADTLGTQTVAVGFGDIDIEMIGTLGRHGAGRLLVANAPQLSRFSTSPYSAALAQLISDKTPRVVFVPSTAAGRDVAPRVAARMELGLVRDCSFIRVDGEGTVVATRPALDGKIAQRVVVEESALLLIPPGIFAEQTFEIDGNPETEVVIMANLPEPDTVVVSSKHLEPADIELNEAEVVVAGGFGMGGESGFRSLEKLAAVLGAKLAASRRATDLGWIDRDALVGQTGTTVRPELYIACGISGASQHVLGMWESKMIIAVNSDANAPIFGLADVGVVGDVEAVVPQLTEAFGQLLGEGVVS
jgi:electron transfer flavoprotein alpha subunit